MAAYKLVTNGTVQFECPTCGHESPSGWDIVGPDDVALDTTFMKKEDAEELAARLNDAYEQGWKDAGKTDTGSFVPV